MSRKHLVTRSLIFVVACALAAIPTLFTPSSAAAQDEILPLKIKVGEKAPDFALPSADGKTVRLSDYAGHNVLIDFYRGYWRPYCMGELGEFVKHYEEFKSLDVQILAISVDPPDKGKWVKEKLKAPFPILSDASQKVMDLYGTKSPEYRNRQGVSINTPTLVLIDKTGTIRWIHQAENYQVRAPVEEDLAQARKLK